jgi:quinohemoprotein ethanol dehydrogenase
MPVFFALAAAPDANWPYAGRDQNGTYFSPLTDINAGNANRLGFAWQYDLGTARGQQATPVVIDGTMYTSGTWGFVYAVDAATGHEKWRFDPHVDGQIGRNPCCDIVNRGVAVQGGRVFVASLDGVLHALNAADGHETWRADTITDHRLPYASTGAPLLAGGLVVIGNAGADMEHGGVPGYVSAYNQKTGALAWRVFTVPPPAGQKPETQALVTAAKTWSATRDPTLQGGGTAWDGLAYDATFNLVYIGTGNGAPYDSRTLGTGDHLYVASILAVDAATGRLVWHYQTTPDDHWDFDAVQKFILADLPVGGTTRHVIMQANKNGFFYVLDRATGELLSARDFTLVTWAKSIDLKTGRPVLVQAGDYFTGPKSVYPSWAGGHTWPPMSFDPATKLVYIPVIDAPSVWVDLQHNHAAVKYLNGFFTINSVIADDSYDAAAMANLFGPMPDLKTLQAGRRAKLVRELLRAWNPVTQSTVWEVETSSGMRGYDGGVLSTAGNLVLQGRGTGELFAYAADTGKVLARIDTGSHIMAAPMTYAVRGIQYVAVQVGYGGTAMAVGAIPPQSAAMRHENTNRILAFRLDGGPVPMPPSRVDPPFPKPPVQTATAAQIRLGEIKFNEQCARCHVFGPSITPDLRKLAPETHAAFTNIVLHGAYAAGGMGSFADVLSPADTDAIHAYLIDQSRAAYRQQP